MNNCTIAASLEHLAAVLNLAAKKDIRYYLNGVQVEAGESETRCIATDGHVLGATRADAVNGMGGAPLLSVLIPRDVLEIAVKANKGKGGVNICHTGGKWEIVTLCGTYGFTPIDGRFPEWRRVIPSEPSGQIGQFNPELLAMFCKAGKALGTKAPVHIDHNGDSGALVTLDGCNEFVGVIMPIRQTNRVAAEVEWATEYPAAPLAAAA